MIKIDAMTVQQLHAQLQSLMDRGLGNLPVVATDCRARYPFQAYTVSNQSGYTDALLIYVRPDAHFVSRGEAPASALADREWLEYRAHTWNAEADETKAACGAFHFSNLKNWRHDYET